MNPLGKSQLGRWTLVIESGYVSEPNSFLVAAGFHASLPNIYIIYTAYWPAARAIAAAHSIRTIEGEPFAKIDA